MKYIILSSFLLYTLGQFEVVAAPHIAAHTSVHVAPVSHPVQHPHTNPVILQAPLLKVQPASSSTKNNKEPAPRNYDGDLRSMPVITTPPSTKLKKCTVEGYYVPVWNCVDIN